MARKKKDTKGIRQKHGGDYLVDFIDEKKERVFFAIPYDELVSLYQNKKVKITKIEFLSKPFYRPVDITEATLEKLKVAKNGK